MSKFHAFCASLCLAGAGLSFTNTAAADVVPPYGINWGTAVAGDDYVDIDIPGPNDNWGDVTRPTGHASFLQLQSWTSQSIALSAGGDGGAWGGIFTVDVLGITGGTGAGMARFDLSLDWGGEGGTGRFQNTYFDASDAGGASFSGGDFVAAASGHRFSVFMPFTFQRGVDFEEDFDKYFNVSSYITAHSWASGSAYLALELTGVAIFDAAGRSIDSSIESWGGAAYPTVSAVPEAPVAWMLLAGVPLVAGAARRQRRVPATA